MKPSQVEPVILHYILKEKDDMFVGHCVEIPSVIAYGSTQKEVETELQNAMRSYFIAFPEQRKIVKREEVKQIEVPV